MNIYEEFGIRDDMLYRIKCENFEITGEILNFDSNQYIIKSYNENGDFNHYIISRSDVKLLKPYCLIDKYKRKDGKALYDRYGFYYGVVGEESNIFDKCGQKLYVGDIVTLTKDGDLIEDSIICKESGKFFVMGLKDIEFQNGIGKTNRKVFVIKKKNDYLQLPRGFNVK